MKNIEMNVSGLKCDNCDYRDDDVKFEDYEKSIGKPCPKCGESLLTQEDYDSVMKMSQVVDIINKFSDEELKEIEKNISSCKNIDDVINKLKNE